MPAEVPDIDALYRRHGAEILGYLARRCPEETAHDLLQETFLQVVRQSARLRGVVLPRAWLFAIARNILASYFRRRRDPTEPEPWTLDAVTSGEDARLPAMREAIGALPPDLRETLELRIDGELSYEEIAAVLEVPIGTVRSRLYTAVRRLRAVLLNPEPDL
jgi:RNA polymerase sigma factor (sigma-70 family)